MKLGSSSNTTPGSWTWLPSSDALTWTFLAVGIVLRLREYLFDRSLWLDESKLALNIINLSPAGLMKPLLYDQAAPLGFLWLEKLSVHALGSGELALRLVPFLSGIASLFLFAAVARRFLTPAMVPLAVGFFAVSEHLIYYSAEAKQYSTDVALVLVLYLLADRLLEDGLKTGPVALAAVLGAAVVWCSHPAIFVLGGIALSMLWMATRKRNWPAVAVLLIPAAIWACSFLLFYLFSLRHLNHNQALLDYWKGAFVPFPPASLSDLSWYEHSFFNTFWYPVGLKATGIAAVAAVLGAMELRARNRGKFQFLLLPILLAVLASGLHRYPFEGRLILFLVPALLLLIAAGLGLIVERTWKALPSLSILLIGVLLVSPLSSAGLHFLRPKGREEIRPAIEYIRMHLSPGDVLYCHHGSERPLQYYRQRGLIGPVQQVTGAALTEDWDIYRRDLDKLRGQKRVWILFSHSWREDGVDEKLFFLDHLDQIGKRLAGFEVTGASAYLYDLSND